MWIRQGQPKQDLREPLTKSTRPHAILSWVADTSSTKGETMSETIKIGNSTITVVDDEFANAFQTGYLRYKVEYQNTSLTDMDLYAFYVETMLGVQHSGRYNTGYLTGWVAALLEYKKLAVPVVPLPPLALTDVEVIV